jgi:hypothetical protein
MTTVTKHAICSKHPLPGEPAGLSRVSQGLPAATCFSQMAMSVEVSTDPVHVPRGCDASRSALLHQIVYMEKVTAQITIEELVADLPASVTYLMEKGIKCIACGEPIWGTLESAAKEKGFNETEIAGFVLDLNGIAGNSKK